MTDGLEGRGHLDAGRQQLPQHIVTRHVLVTKLHTQHQCTQRLAYDWQHWHLYGVLLDAGAVGRSDGCYN
jgi:hypothetical protein